MADCIKDRVAVLEERIEAACRLSGRKRSEIALMGVSKFQPIEAVTEAWSAGIRLFGENRVQEAAGKYAGFREAHPRETPNGEYASGLHLIGTLQRNKARAAAALFDCIHSVDRDSLIDELGKMTLGRDCPLTVLLEYHTGEESKAGYPSVEGLYRAAEKLLAFPGLRPAGLMTMAPFSPDKKLVRASFRALAAAREGLIKRFGGGWSCLSMGMTNDFEIAIEEGSTLIRIGTAIFGERKG